MFMRIMNTFLLSLESLLLLLHVLVILVVTATLNFVIRLFMILLLHDVDNFSQVFF